MDKETKARNQKLNNILDSHAKTTAIEYKEWWIQYYMSTPVSEEKDDDVLYDEFIEWRNNRNKNKY